MVCRTHGFVSLIDSKVDGNFGTRYFDGPLCVVQNPHVHLFLTGCGPISAVSQQSGCAVTKLAEVGGILADDKTNRQRLELPLRSWSLSPLHSWLAIFLFRHWSIPSCRSNERYRPQTRPMKRCWAFSFSQQLHGGSTSLFWYGCRITSAEVCGVGSLEDRDKLSVLPRVRNRNDSCLLWRLCGRRNIDPEFYRQWSSEQRDWRITSQFIVF